LAIGRAGFGTLVLAVVAVGSNGRASWKKIDRLSLFGVFLSCQKKKIGSLVYLEMLLGGMRYSLGVHYPSAPKRCLNKPRTGAFWGFNILVKLQIQLVPGRIQAGNGTRN
jgi:hypothetical protein